MKDLHLCTDHLDLRRMQKMIKNRRTQLKNQYYKQLADCINMTAEARDVEKEFALAKKYTALKTGQKLAISNDKLKTHFEKHFAERKLPIPPEIENPEQYPQLRDESIPVNEEAPDEEEVLSALKSFKNNKSAGTDKVRTEGLKYIDTKNLVTVILTLQTLIWTNVKVPTTWLHCSITCLFKKDLMNDVANYRGLSIGANMSRILAKIIMNRLKRGYETHISETQYGFRQNRSTSDGIFVVKTVIDKCAGTLMAIYIDLTAAYSV